MPRAKQLDISEDILRIKRIRQIDIAQLIQRIEVEGGLDLIHCDARAALDREGKVLGDGDRRFFVRTARRFVEDDGRCDLAGAVNGQRRDMPVPLAAMVGWSFSSSMVMAEFALLHVKWHHKSLSR